VIEMAKTEYFKIKNLRQIKIKKPKSINNLLNQGYSISKVTIDKNKTTIKTYSPMTKSQAYKKSLRNKLLKRKR